MRTIQQSHGATTGPGTVSYKKSPAHLIGSFQAGKQYAIPVFSLRESGSRVVFSQIPFFAFCPPAIPGKPDPSSV
jgi:hypothetical protein